MTRTSAGTDLVLIDGSGVETGLMLARPGPPATPGDGTPLTISELIAAASADAPVSKRLVPAIHVNTGGGVGIDYNAFEGGYSRTPGFYCPAGAAGSVAVPAPTTAVGGPIVAIKTFANDVWFCQAGQTNPPVVGAIGGRIFRSINGSAAPTTTTFAAYGGATSITVGQIMRDLFIADDGLAAANGTQRLWAMSSDAGTGLNGRLHWWDGATWQTTAAATFALMPDGVNRWGRGRTKVVNWQTADGSVGNRIVTISSKNTISYTRPDSDPTVAANWIEGVKLGTGYTLTELAAARHHVYGLALDGLFDLDGMGTSVNLTSYMADEIQTGTGLAGGYHNGYVYMSSGRGIDRIYVGANGQLQERPGQCAPGWGTVAENAYRGYMTAFCTDQGYVVVPIHNPTTQTTGIFWGLDQQTEGSRNPLTWYGPEFFFTTDYKVTAMATTGAAGDLRLWVAAQSVAGLTPILRYQSLPVAGSPLQDLLSPGTGVQQFNTGAGGVAFTQTYCRLSLIADTVGDEISTKILDRVGVGSRGLSIDASGANDGFGTKLTAYSRADPDPGSTAWGTGVDATVKPSQTILPAATTSGHRLENRIDFFSPQGAAATPKIAVLTAMRRDTWRVAPDFPVWRPIVEYGAGVRNLNDVADTRDPDTVSATLRSLTQQSRITVRDRQNKTWTIHLEQVLDANATLSDEGFGKTVRRQLELSIIAGPL